jgi:hypothetical protein
MRITDCDPIGLRAASLGPERSSEEPTKTYPEPMRAL